MKKIIPVSLCICTTLFASATMAQQSVAQSSTMKGDISAFHGDQDTLIHAIRTIEKSTGGKVTEIRFSQIDGKPGFHAVVAKGGKVSFVHVQERSESVVQIDANNGPPWMMNWRSKAIVHFAETATVSLETAIRTAEQAQNAPAIAAGIARSASNPTSDVKAYNVLVAVDGDAKRIAVDDSTGEVIADPSALSSF